MSQSDPVSIRIPEALRRKIRYYRALRLANTALPELTVSEVVLIALQQFFAEIEVTDENSMNLIDESFHDLVKKSPPKADVDAVFDPKLAADPEGPSLEAPRQPLFDDEQWKDTPKSKKSKK